ncbi:disease resistance protein Pik-2-like [Oryza brachyantha]|uniref:disease resistance protein Pik-2-like n=1 Tax=Oryza brachyantha TaxID=4533 RepID=UPI001AD9C37E|nr:disease resistance protein Pik-2-like [Oryza brachyantha]
MESTVLSLGKFVLGGALGYAQSAVAEEVALQLGIQRDHAFVRDELAMMRSFLMVAHEEEREHNKVVRTWVQQVRDVAYDVEDCLQDMAVRSSRWRKCCSPRALLERRRVAKKMKELRAKVEDVSQRNMRYRLIRASGSGSAAGRQHLAGTTPMPAASVDEARWQQEKASADLVRLISRKDDELRVIAVWGPSDALDKTSIVRRAYGDLKTSGKFDCYACVSLMSHFNQKEFLLSIVSQFIENHIEAAMERQEKQAPPTDVLRNMVMAKEDDIYLVDAFLGYVEEKNYLIVLNDVSTIEEWGRIKPYFPNNKKGSRVIVTTKQVGVATLCVGPESAAPELMHISSDRTLHVFYEKGAQDGTDPTKHGSSSKKEDGAAALNEFELIGRVDEKNDITNLVSKKDIKGRHVISVWGMGGVGKTTLVREVYQSPELSGMFDKRAWVTIMRPFNCSHHLKSLAVQFGDGNKADNLTVLLQGKKYLIVLDDVWFISEWNEIVPHLPETAGSCVIVTTRQQSIAKHCSNKESDDIHILRMLESNHARELFTRKVFKEDNWEEKYPELVGQVEPIIKKCNGLPLAIVTIGGFLANQPKSVLTWRKLNEHISAELEMNPELDTIRTVLLKSYDGLPYHLKSCFLYLCIFPEDHKVSRKRLMQRWIAEGYACEARGKSSIEIAHDNFIELISRSMVLPAAQNSIKLGRGIDYCQLHDLMREISITKSIEENLVLRLEDGCSSNSHGATRHLAISSNWKGDEHEFQSIVDLSRVRSITVFGRWKPFFISEKMRMLRVLDLEDAHGLVEHHLEHIGKLIHLKYLSLSGYGNILHLPDSLGNLRQLETLDIRYTTIAILPRTIVKLRKLKYLHAGASGMSSSKSLAERSLRLLRNGSCLCGACCAPCLLEDLDWYEPYSAGGFSRRDACNYICCVQPHILSMDLDNYYPMLPRGIRKLKGLHTLQHVHLAWGNVATREIERLTQLRRLGVTGINKKNGPAFCSAISKLGRLESLSVLGSYELGLRGCLEYRGTSSTSPSPPENLQSLRLIGQLGKLPQWIGKLQNLMKLRLEETALEDADAAIQVLGALPSLAILRLQDSFKGGVRPNFRQPEATAILFPSLRVLDLYFVGSGSGLIKSVQFGGGAAPKLEVLLYLAHFCDIGLLSGLEELPSLKEFMLDNNEIYTDEFVEDVRKQLANHPNTNKPLLKRYDRELLFARN